MIKWDSSPGLSCQGIEDTNTTAASEIPDSSTLKRHVRFHFITPKLFSSRYFTVKHWTQRYGYQYLVLDGPGGKMIKDCAFKKFLR